MNKFAFFFPAKIIFAEREIPDFNTYVYKGLEFKISRKNIYFCSKKNRIVIEDSFHAGAGDFKQIWLNVAGHFIYCATTSELDNWMEKNHSHIEENLDKWAEKIKHPEIYEQEATAQREKRQAERAESDRILAERKAAREKEAEQDYQDSLKKFSSGEQIPWCYFESACKQYAVNIPIKTIGFGRKNITSIGKTSMTARGEYNSPIVWRAVKELQSKMLTQKIM